MTGLDAIRQRLWQRLAQQPSFAPDTYGCIQIPAVDAERLLVIAEAANAVAKAPGRKELKHELTYLREALAALEDASSAGGNP